MEGIRRLSIVHCIGHSVLFSVTDKRSGRLKSQLHNVMVGYHEFPRSNLHRDRYECETRPSFDSFDAFFG